MVDAKLNAGTAGGFRPRSSHGIAPMSFHANSRCALSAPAGCNSIQMPVMTLNRPKAASIDAAPAVTFNERTLPVAHTVMSDSRKKPMGRVNDHLPRHGQGGVRRASRPNSRRHRSRRCRLSPRRVARHVARSTSGRTPMPGFAKRCRLSGRVPSDWAACPCISMQPIAALSVIPWGGCPIDGFGAFAALRRTGGVDIDLNSNMIGNPACRWTPSIFAISPFCSMSTARFSTSRRRRTPSMCLKRCCERSRLSESGPTAPSRSSAAGRSPISI